MALTVIGTSPWPVMKTIGMLICAAARRLATRRRRRFGYEGGVPGDVGTAPLTRHCSVHAGNSVGPR
jgi:hypothetical protein